MSINFLSDYRLLRIAGKDRCTYLQGQLTQDLDRLERDIGIATGWANAKGRLVLTAGMIDWNDAVWLTIPAALAPSAAQRLTLYVLRAAVSITVSDFAISGLHAGPSGEPLIANPERGTCHVARLGYDPGRLLAIGPRRDLEAALAPAAAQSLDDAQWGRADIAAGWPVISAATSEKFVPQMVNLDLLDAISFTKGCYIGQEVVARTQHLGRIKRRMMRYRCAATKPLASGDPVVDVDGNRVGQIVSVARVDDTIELLAVVALTAIAAPIYAAAELLEPLTLPYEIPGIDG